MTMSCTRQMRLRWLRRATRWSSRSTVPGVTAPYPSTLTFVLNVQSPLYLPINVYAVVYFRSGVAPSAGAAAIRAALTSFFAIVNDDGSPNTNVDFGYKQGVAVAMGDLAWDLGCKVTFDRQKREVRKV